MELSAIPLSPIQGALAICAILICLYRILVTKSIKLPPGPKGLPLVGNIFDLPPKDLPAYWHWKKFEKYGPISSITVLGTTLVLLNDTDLVMEVLEKQAAKTSGRSGTVFGTELCGYNRFFATRNMDEETRAQRKLIYQVIGTPKLAARFNDKLQKENARLLLRTLKQPQDLVAHFRTALSAVILNITFGYTIESHVPDPLVTLAESFMHHFGLAFTPGSWLVDLITPLRYAPSWLPGAGFQKTAQTWKEEFTTVTTAPIDFALDQIKQHINMPSFVSRAVENLPGINDEEMGQRPTAEEKIRIGNAALALYAGGTDTSVAVLTSFLLAMTQHPDIQAKAQEELDRVLGDRLPEPEDSDMLPFLNSVMLETLRWWPTAPTGFYHTAMEDITVGEYTIPKGSMLMPNVYRMLNDPKTYQNPTKFDPDRYMAPRNEPDPRFCAFGFGRRACPGQNLANSSIFLTIACVLSAFKISKAVDAQGRVMEPIASEQPGEVNHPTPFPFEITPRSERHAEMIRDLENVYPWEESHSSYLDRKAYPMVPPANA